MNPGKVLREAMKEPRMVYARVAGCAVLLGRRGAACSRQRAPADAVPRNRGRRRGTKVRAIAMSPDEVHIDYRVYGTRRPPPWVLVHGWASDANYWKRPARGSSSRAYTVGWR